MAANMEQAGPGTEVRASQEDFNRFIDLCEGGDDWKSHVDNDDIKVWSRKSTPIDIIRVMAKIDVPASVMYDVLHDSEYRETWDDNMIDGYEIERLDAYNDVGYYSAKVSFIFGLLMFSSLHRCRIEISVIDVLGGLILMGLSILL